MNRPEKLWVKGSDAEESRNQDVPERERRPRLARGDEEPRSDVTGMTTQPPYNGARPSISHQHSQSSIMSEPPGPSNTKPYMSQPRPTHAIYSGQGFKPTIQAPPPNPSGTQVSNSHVTPNSRESPIDLEKSDLSPVRRSLFSSPKSSGPLGTDINSQTSLPENDSTMVDLDEPGFTCPDEDINNNEVNTAPPAAIIRGQTTTCPATPAMKSLPPPPVTPAHNTVGKDSSFSRSPSNLFKTPSNASGGTQSNQRVTSSDFFPSSAKKLLHGASLDITPSKAGGKSPEPYDDRFSPQFPRLLRVIYGNNSPEAKKHSDPYAAAMDDLFTDCCPGYTYHKQGCEKREIMLNQPDVQDLLSRPEFLGTDEDWLAADEFFNSKGVTGFTPRKGISTNSMEQENETV